MYTLTGKVLLLRRADDPSFWQSVTGSLTWEETAPSQAAARELREETGLEPAGLREAGWQNRFSIMPQWRQRYAPEVNENLEHVFFLALPAETDIVLNPAEHTEYGWYAFEDAARKVASWSNREAILRLIDEAAASPGSGHE